MSKENSVIMGDLITEIGVSMKAIAEKLKAIEEQMNKLEIKADKSYSLARAVSNKLLGE